jgi:tRNA modification GTPase
MAAAAAGSLLAAACVARTERVCDGMNAVADAAERVAFQLREAVDEIGRIAGEVTTTDLLGRVFGRFCIGK